MHLQLTDFIMFLNYFFGLDMDMKLNLNFFLLLLFKSWKCIWCNKYYWKIEPKTTEIYGYKLTLWISRISLRNRTKIVIIRMKRFKNPKKDKNRNMNYVWIISVFLISGHHNMTSRIPFWFLIHFLCNKCSTQFMNDSRF